MKLTRKKLRKIIQEAVYVPAGISKDDIQYSNQLRKNMSPERMMKADSFTNSDSIEQMKQGMALGGMPPEHDDNIKEKVFNLKDGSSLDFAATDVPFHIDEILEGDDAQTLDDVVRILISEYGVDESFLIDLSAISEEYSIYNRQDLINILRNYAEDAIMNHEDYALGPDNEIIDNRENDFYGRGRW